MVHRFASFIGAVAALALGATSAHATFACEIAMAPKAGAPLHVAAQAKATVIRHLPNGTIVSLLDRDGDKRPKGWTHVAHSAKGEAAWGAGDKGWIEAKFLKDCG